MSDFDVAGGFKSLFLASVGAVAMGAEKSQEVLGELVRKGELTVEQGKTFNQELTRKAREAVDGATDAALRARMEAMTPEEREAFARKVARMSEDLSAESVTVDVEDADAESGDDAPDAGSAEA